MNLTQTVLNFRHRPWLTLHIQDLHRKTLRRKALRRAGRLPMLTLLLVGALVLAACAPMVTPASEMNDQAAPVPGVTPEINVETFSMSTFARMGETIDFQILDETAAPIGQIEDYVIDLTSAQAPYVIASFDAFDGLEGELFPIPYEFVRIDPLNVVMRVPVDEEILRSAPRIDSMDTSAAAFSPTWDRNVRLYWRNTGLAVPESSNDFQTEPVTLPYYRYGVGLRTLPETVMRYSDFLHEAVTDAQGQTLGQVEDLVFDRLIGEVPYLAILWDAETLAPDDFLAGNLGLMPVGAFTWNTEEASLVFDMEPATLSAAPRFAPTEWPDLEMGEWRAEVQNYWRNISPAVALRAGVRILPEAVMRTSNVLNRTVNSITDENLGTLEDLIVNVANGDVMYAVLDLSGFFDLEDEYHVVPANSLTLDPTTDMAVLGVDRQTLENSPTLDVAMLGEIIAPGWDDPYEAYWQDWLIPPVSDEQRVAESAQLDIVPGYATASSLMGYTVENSEGEALGNVEDIVLNLTQGRVAYTVLSFGGFLGIGDKLFAVPMTLLTPDMNMENEILTFNVAPEQLEEIPGFDQGNWPEIGSSSWRSEVSEYWSNQS